MEYISLGNLIAGRKVFRELIQYYLTPDNLVDEVRRLVQDEEYRAEMQAGYEEIRSALGGSGASRAVAKSVCSGI